MSVTVLGTALRLVRRALRVRSRSRLRLPRLAPQASLGDAVATRNANVDRINWLLFAWLDYAAVGRRP